MTEEKLLITANSPQLESAEENNIITDFEYPPIPIRYYDWSAVRKNYDEGDLIGYGKNKQEAIDNLIEQEKERV